MSQAPAAWMRDTLREGLKALSVGRIVDASECARRVLGAKADLPEGHFLVGLIALEARQTRTAVSAFGSVTKLNPHHGAAWAQLAKLLFTIGQPAQADHALAEAIRHESGDPIVHDLIGVVHALLGDTNEASIWFRKAASEDPDNPAFLVNLANNEMYLGNLQTAEEGLHRALAVQPGSAQAHWVLSGLKKAGDFDHVDTLKRLAKQPGKSPQAYAFLNYALGKELEDLEQWDDAFDAFAEGASQRRRIMDFDEGAEIAMFAALQKTFTAAWLSEQGDGCQTAAPIFVVGQPRTGTTLIERVITSHSQVHSAGELRQFGNSIRRLAAYQGHGRYSAELVEQAATLHPAKLGTAYVESSKKVQGDTPRFVDKLPPNFLYVPLILAALPQAKIIHVRRDPMDASFASFKQLFADAYPHSYDQREMARHHARYYHLMQHYREQFGERFFEIHYEDTARNLEANARSLIEYLGLPWEDACLDFHRQRGAVTTASSVQVREPVHTKSIGRWKRYLRQLAPMRDEFLKQGVPLDRQDVA